MSKIRTCFKTNTLVCFFEYFSVKKERWIHKTADLTNNILTYHGLDDVPVDSPGALVGLNGDGVVVDKSSALPGQLS
jgi:hypothetical protein